jgi:hypothetical protein
LTKQGLLPGSLPVVARLATPLSIGPVYFWFFDWQLLLLQQFD